MQEISYERQPASPQAVSIVCLRCNETYSYIATTGPRRKYCDRCTPDIKRIQAAKRMKRYRQRQPLMKQQKRNTGYVYVIQAIATEHIRIGKSGSADKLRKRLNSHYNNVPGGTVTLFSYKSHNPKSLERFLHDYFANKRINSEWFTLNQADIEEIPRLVKGYESDTN